MGRVLGQFSQAEIAAAIVVESAAEIVVVNAVIATVDKSVRGGQGFEQTTTQDGSLLECIPMVAQSALAFVKASTLSFCSAQFPCAFICLAFSCVMVLVIFQRKVARTAPLLHVVSVVKT